MAMTTTTMTSKKKRHKVPGLQHLLSYRRAHNSVGERRYIEDHIYPLNPEVIATAAGEVMAFIVRVGTSPIMFTSHTDSVHLNVDNIWQQVFLEKGIYLKKDNQPLGADDAAGNWLMFHMIAAKVPGTYAFFRGEERGGIGSTFCAENRKELFDKIECAIAFDRKGKTSVITHQGMRRGCSDEFGRSLARILKMSHGLDKTGVYTDTAEFFDLVDNCTNLSVGYENEHSKRETLDKRYIESLKDALIAADWSKLDFTRPVPDPVSSRGIGISLWQENDTRYYPTREMFPDDEFDDEDDGITALTIADDLFAYACRLPNDLRDAALTLAQEIYERFE